MNDNRQSRSCSNLCSITGAISSADSGGSSKRKVAKFQNEDSFNIAPGDIKLEPVSNEERRITRKKKKVMKLKMPSIKCRECSLLCKRRISHRRRHQSTHKRTQETSSDFLQSDNQKIIGKHPKSEPSRMNSTIENDAESMDSTALGTNNVDEDNEKCEASKAENYNLEEDTSCTLKGKIQLTDEQRLQLEEQIRMFVQLVTQSYLLSYRVPFVNDIHTSSKKILEELKEVASNGATAFNAHNLDGAIAIINEYENGNKIHITQKHYKSLKQGHTGIPHKEMKKTMLVSKVFMYPELLPIRGFCRFETIKHLFLPAEDNLIALGLEKFSSSKTPICDIQSTLLPCKTVNQIKIRIKNTKYKGSPNHPINYYLKHKKVPSFPRTVQVFNPDDVKAPKDQPIEVLPDWALYLKQEVYQKSQGNQKPYRKILPDVYQKSQGNHQIPYREILPAGIHLPSFQSANLSSVQMWRRKSPRLILPKPTNNSEASTNMKVTENKNLNLDETNKINGETENNLNANMNLVNSYSTNCNMVYLRNGSVVNITPAIDINANAGQFHNNLNIGMLDKNPQEVCNATLAMNSEVIKTVEVATDSSAEVCGVTIKLEVMEDNEESMSHCLVNSGIKRTFHSIFDSVIKSDKEAADHKNFRKSKIKNNNGQITSTSESVSNVSASQSNAYIKQEFIDESDKSTDVAYLMNNEITKTSECVSDFSTNEYKVPIKSEAIDVSSVLSTQNVSKTACTMNSVTTRLRKTFIKSNALQVAHYKKNKRSRRKKKNGS